MAAKRILNALSFGQRADGRIRYDFPQALEKLGYAPLELRDAEFYAVCGHAQEFADATSRAIKRLSRIVSAAESQGDERARAMFSILRRWACRTKRHLLSLSAR